MTPSTTTPPPDPVPPAPPTSRRRKGAGRRLRGRARTLLAVCAHFLHPARFVLAPLLLVLLAAGALLWLTGGLAYVAPFVYTLF